MFSRREFLFSAVLPLMQGGLVLKENRQGLVRTRWLEGEIETFDVKIAPFTEVMDRTGLQLTLTNKNDSFSVFDLTKLVFVLEKPSGFYPSSLPQNEQYEVFRPKEVLNLAPKATKKIIIVLTGDSFSFDPKRKLRVFYNEKAVEIKIQENEKK